MWSQRTPLMPGPINSRINSGSIWRWPWTLALGDHLIISLGDSSFHFVYFCVLMTTIRLYVILFPVLFFIYTYIVHNLYWIKLEKNKRFEVNHLHNVISGFFFSFLSYTNLFPTAVLKKQQLGVWRLKWLSCLRSYGAGPLDLIPEDGFRYTF